MRFDIRSGGIVGILIGILLLSGAVFVMGLLAGYDIGHQSQIAVQQLAVDYPLPAPAAAASQAAVASVPVAESRAAPRAPVASPVAGSPPATPRKQLATAAKPEAPVKPVAADSADEPPDLTDESAAPAPEASTTPDRVAAVATPAAPSTTRRKPFNIQIQAAMDAAGANEMMKRLEALGYRPHIAPTELNGATWYKVEVGPYTTREAAAAAEVDLREKYNATYGGGAATPEPSDTASKPEEE
ncbi:MAG: SPOR domain-containing protein [Candidatus Binataceae bacterium]